MPDFLTWEQWLGLLPAYGYDDDFVRNHLPGLRSLYERTSGAIPAPMPKPPAEPAVHYDRYSELDE